ncbi:hypothetical protein LZD57_17135 [Jiella sp. CBK1P-4]|uniref:Uncharacterized protein n=2 Tax=Jiella avicenniae TaxID=2907202 RepID=A0A9X1P4I6_9HYPH|nr:hypothetical protein [Jiella avicenniae]
MAIMMASFLGMVKDMMVPSTSVDLAVQHGHARHEVLVSNLTDLAKNPAGCWVALVAETGSDEEHHEGTVALRGGSAGRPAVILRPPGRSTNHPSVVSDHGARDRDRSAPRKTQKNQRMSARAEHGHRDRRRTGGMKAESAPHHPVRRRLLDIIRCRQGQPQYTRFLGSMYSIWFDKV